MSDIVDFTSTSAKNESFTLTSTTQMESSKNYFDMSDKVLCFNFDCHFFGKFQYDDCNIYVLFINKCC
jgi:hypothetical protein